MDFMVLASLECTDGNCPKIAKRGRTYFVQGKRTDRNPIPELAGVPDWESVVAIDEDDMHALLAQLRP